MNLTLTTETFGRDDQSWLGSAHGTDSARSGTLDVALLTAGTHYPEGFVRSGTPVGVVTATGLYGPYDGAATDGRQALVGHVLAAVPVKTGSTRVSFALFDHGRVVTARLPIAVDAAGQADAAGRIQYV